jgi:hypothetical protein
MESDGVVLILCVVAAMVVVINGGLVLLLLRSDVGRFYSTVVRAFRAARDPLKSQREDLRELRRRVGKLEPSGKVQDDHRQESRSQ